MTQNQNILAYSSAHCGGYVMCTVPNTYQEKIPEQVRPSCGFYAAAYVLNCLKGNSEYTDETLSMEAKTYPLGNSSEEKLTAIGEVFYPPDFANFINTLPKSICSAACQPFSSQTIYSTIRSGGYILIPFEVINKPGDKSHGFPNTNVQDGDPPHAHWCVIAGHLVGDETKLLAKHWGKNYLFGIDDLRKSNGGNYPPHKNQGLTEDRGKDAKNLRGQIITIISTGGHDDSPQYQKGCSC